jgi:hypothetical protein
MYRLDNFCYAARDYGHVNFWSLHGNVYGRDPPYREGVLISVSTPSKLDRAARILTTKSGSQYQLMECAANEDGVFAQIDLDIARGSYEAH